MGVIDELPLLRCVLPAYGLCQTPFYYTFYPSIIPVHFILMTRRFHFLLLPFIGSDEYAVRLYTGPAFFIWPVGWYGTWNKLNNSFTSE